MTLLNVRSEWQIFTKRTSAPGIGNLEEKEQQLQNHK